MKKDIKDMVTIAYAADREFLESLTVQLDELDLLTKTEEGKIGGADGYCVEYSRGNKTLFWAMIHSNQKSFLIRADKHLFEAA